MKTTSSRSYLLGAWFAAALLLPSFDARGQTPILQDSATQGTVATGGWIYYQVEIPADSPGWRLVLAPRNGVAGNARLYIRQGSQPTTGSYTDAVTTGTPKTLWRTEGQATAGTWFVGVYLPSGNAAEDFTLHSQTGWVTDLTWDPGSADLGSQTFTIPANDPGGLHHFRITTPNSQFGLWRQVLRVTSGEAHLYVRQNSAATTSGYNTKSERVGSDGLVSSLSTSSGAGQTWYLAVNAQPGAQWSLFAGDIHVRDLGPLAADATSGSGADVIPIEGWRFFRTTVPNGALGWRLWLQDAAGAATWEHPFRVRKNQVPHPSTSWDRNFTGQALEVPPYLTPGSSDAFFVSVEAEPGTAFRLDSRQQEVTDITFTSATGTVTADGYRFRTFRVTVPPDRLGWEVTSRRISGNPDLAIRRGLVPNARDNDAFSEAPGAADDSVTLVQPDLSDGSFFITVHSSASHSFQLQSREPVITPIAFTSSTPNNDPNRTGWRYFSITDISSQLGQLGWLLQLANQVPGTEIAIRRNNLPGRWERRNNDSSQSQSRNDQYSTNGILQRPNQQADIWYVGVYTPSAPLGGFTLNAGPLVPVQLSPSTTQTVSGLGQNEWSYYRVDVPATLGGQTVRGWELRVVSWSGVAPTMYVRRDQLPSESAGWIPNYSSYYNDTSWPSGAQVGVSSSDWTGRSYSADGSKSPETFLLSSGMGQPLEPGTYYIGFRHTSSGQTSSFTWTSRVIGDAGSGLDYEITPLAVGGSVSGTLAPRAVAYHALDVPEDTASQKLRLSVPSGHEAQVYIRKDYLPNSEAGGSPNNDPTTGTTRLRKEGGEYFVHLPQWNQTTLTAGRYYVMVVGEGQNPADSNRVGTGDISYTLAHLGEAPVGDLGTLPVSGTVSQAGSYDAGEVKLHRFTVPAGVLALEVRLEDRVGSPRFGVRSGEIAPYFSTGSGIYGFYTGYSYNDYSDTLVTIPNPAPGVYAVSVGDSRVSTPATGSYTLRVVAVGATPVPMSTTQTVSGLGQNEWSYYRVDVPATFEGQAVRGWELRVASWSGVAPTMYVRRDQLPSESAGWGSSSSYYYATNWPSGGQVSASSGDWTGRNYSADVNQWPGESFLLSSGMGQPLEPGTYYIGFRHTSSGQTSSFTWTSRVIGDEDSGLDYEITPLAVGGSVSGTLAPRAVAYHALDVPEDTASQKLRLSVPSGHEAQVYIRKDYLPNSQAGGSPNNDPTTGTTRLRKEGGEYFVHLPQWNQTTLTAGRYYVMVVGEGQNPADSNRVGTGDISYTLAHLGEAPVGDLGTLPVSGTVSQAGSYDAGEVKLHRFTVPAGVLALEVRLEDRVGSPRFGVRAGEIAPYFSTGSGIYGFYTGYSYNDYSDTLVTIPNPAPGVYAVSVGDNRVNTPAMGSYTLRVVAVGATPVPMSTTQTVSGLGQNEWSYYRVDVPATLGGQTVRGWELRVASWSGVAPTMYVRRDQLPSESAGWGSSSSYSNDTSWPSGGQVSASSGDWTGRNYSPDGNQWPGESFLLSSGMGQPLEPGTYYIGFRHTSSGQTSSFTWTSRVIGDAGSGLDYEITPLAVGGSVNGTLAPRAVAYYALDVPEDVASQKLRLNVPSGHEAQVYIRKDYLPNSNAGGSPNNDPTTGTTRLSKEGGEYFVHLPRWNQTTLTAGRYYVMVVGEGQNPAASHRIGTGDISYTLAHLGEAPVGDLGTLPVSGTVSQAGSYDAGEVKLHRFTIPAGVLALEVRLENRVGSPRFGVRAGEIAPYFYTGSGIYGFYTGYSYDGYSDTLVTIPNPAPGVYAVSVGDNRVSTPATGSYTLRTTAIGPVELAAAGTGSVSEPLSLVGGQSRYFQVNIPGEWNGEAVLGWRLDLQESSGSTRVRVRRGTAPSGSSGSSQDQTNWKTGSLLAVPGFLTPGMWFVEVQGVTDATVSLTSSLVVDSSMLRAWTMPASGQASEHPGLAPGFFGDTGVAANGSPLPGDQGVDLPAGNYHLYAIDVPENNGGLLRTVLEAIGGNPDLYIRPLLLPSLDHNIWPQGGGSSQTAYLHRLTSTTQSEYGSWVPFDVKNAAKLEPGRWYLKVHAADSTNARYRLRLSHDASPQIQNLALNGGSFTGQILAGTDWRYYRVQMPEDPAALPEQWTLTFATTQGNVAMYLRDSAPPGQWETNGAGSSSSSSNPRHWTPELLDPGSYGRFTTPGTYVIQGRDLRPGRVYYIGFRAGSDAAFSVSSSASTATVGDTYGQVATISATGGSASVTLAPGETRTWRVESPAEATRWYHTSTHAASVQVYLRENFLPYLTSSDLWRSNGAANSTRNSSYGSYEMRERTFFLTAVNTSGSPQTYSLTVDWRQYALTINTANGSVSRSPSQSLYNNGQVVTLTANPSSGFQFNGWSGDLTGTQNPATITMDGPKTVTANFGPIQRTLTLNAENGSITASPDKATYDNNETVTLTAVPAPGYEFTGWFGALSGNTNPQTLVMSSDRTVTANFSLAFDADALSPSGLSFTRGGSGQWYLQGEVTREGRSSAARSGNTAHSTTSWIETTVTGPGVLTYWRRVSSESGWDIFRARVDGSVVETLSGEVGWSRQMIQVPAGSHTIRWEYQKDGSANNGLDAAFLDEVVWIPTSEGQHILILEAEHGSISVSPDKTAYDDGEVVTLTAVPDSGYEFAGWSGDLSGTTNPQTLVMSSNRVVTASFVPPLPSFNSGVSPSGLAFTQGGSGPWYLQDAVKREGRFFSARSGNTGHSTTSWIETTVTGPGTLTYWRRVSSESGYDFFRARVDGTVVEERAGDVAWAMQSIEIPEGSHTIRWEYQKDSSVSGGLDAAFLDEVVWTPTGGFASWNALSALPADRRGALDRNGPMNLPNMMAYAMGLDPLTATAADMPRVAEVNRAAGTMTYVFRRSKAAIGVALSVHGSGSLQSGSWEGVQVLGETVTDHGDWEAVQLLIAPPPGNRYFLRLSGEF